MATQPIVGLWGTEEDEGQQELLVDYPAFAQIRKEH